MKRIIITAMALVALSASGMPTKDELAEAQVIVGELMADHIAANNKGKETSEAVGDAAMALSGDAEGEAAKFVLFKGAVSYYAKAREYDKAADAVEAIMAQIDGVPPQTLYGIVSKVTANVTAAKAPRLFALKKALGARAKVAKALTELELKLKKTPQDSVLRRAHAELVAASGDWEAALKEFIALSGTIGLIAESEAEGKAADAAEFWYTYTAAAPEAQSVIKEHAAALYRRALENGELEGLKRNLAEKRIAEIDASGMRFAIQTKVVNADALYCVIDISKGPKTGRYPVTYTNELSKDVLRDDGASLVLRRVKAGKDPLGRYSLSKDYYISVLEVTQKQWEQVVGECDRIGKIKQQQPMTMVSVLEVRGVEGGAAVGNSGFCGMLAKRTGQPGFDLPTEAQWEYAVRVGATAKLSSVWERCRDFNNPLSGIDPVGETSGMCVANCAFSEKTVRHARTNLTNPLQDRGFRIVLNIK